MNLLARLLRAAAVASLLAAPAIAAAAPPSAGLKAVIAAFDRYQRDVDPIAAGLEGDRAALSRWPDDSPKAIAARKAALISIQRRLALVKPAGLAPEERLNRDFLARIVRDQLEGLAFDQEREPFSTDNGPFDTADYLARTTAIHDQADAEAWLARLHALAGYYDVEMANARRGISTGFVQPRYIVEKVIKAAKGQVEQPVAESPLLTPLQLLPSTISAAEQASLRQRALDAVSTEVRPRERAYVALLTDEYLPKARPGLAARDLPDGERYYAWLARHYTTTALTPDQIHALGEKEVARIRAEMDAVMAATGFKGSFAEFLADLRSNPKFYVTSRQAMLEKASEIAKRIDDKLPAYFATLPRLTYGVRPVPAEIEDGYTTGRYFQGSPDQGIAGGYMVNTSHLDQRPLYELPALTLHEAVPGHHLQIALSQERKDLPYFRRNADVTAYTEGWGLYSESLGEEMGIYRDPYERFGRLSYEMWRACRLVADTGVHWLRWSREQAAACFVQNSALAQKNIDVELDRYISWPGQALAYKVGELKLQALRKRAEAALGPRFDIRRFHDQILLPGPLPLDLLDQRIDAWIKAETGRK